MASPKPAGVICDTNSRISSRSSTVRLIGSIGGGSLRSKGGVTFWICVKDG